MLPYSLFENKKPADSPSPRDVDQVKADMTSPAHLARYTDSKIAEELPGLGRHYCVSCAKWFETVDALGCHRRGKPHRRRLKQLAEVPYSQKEAEAAIGLRTDNGESTLAAAASRQLISEAAQTGDIAMS